MASRSTNLAAGPRRPPSLLGKAARTRGRILLWGSGEVKISYYLVVVAASKKRAAARAEPFCAAACRSKWITSEQSAMGWNPAAVGDATDMGAMKLTAGTGWRRLTSIERLEAVDWCAENRPGRQAYHQRKLQTGMSLARLTGKTPGRELMRSSRALRSRRQFVLQPALAAAAL